MKYLLDTNVWIDAAALRNRADHAMRVVTNSEWGGYSAITRLELMGFPGLSLHEERELSALLGMFSEVAVDTLVIDRAIAIRRTRRIKVPDAIIAATALVTDAVLITRNEVDFKGIRGLHVVTPSEMNGH